MLRDVWESLGRIQREDPAAPSRLEILVLYPSVHAVFWYRIAHALWLAKIPFVPRLISQLVRAFTLIEIHPGAAIGRRFFVDHGAAVVIGETTEIGDDVLLYHQVTLGGTSLNKGKRHPTLGNGVVVGAGAAILGPVRIGDGARIGAGSVVLRDVPEGATVVGVPGRVAFIAGRPVHTSHHAAEPLPDPEASAIKDLAERLAVLEETISRLAPPAVPVAARGIAVEDFLHGSGV